MARLKANIKVRIVKVKLKKWKNIKYYFTNIPKEIATPEELKQLYGDRWTIETNYDRLKNNIKNRKIHRKKENNNRTRLL